MRTTTILDMRKRVRFDRSIVYLLFLCGTGHTLVSAQNRLDSLQQLQELTVSASRRTEVIAPQKLSGDELEKLNSLSVADAIRYFSGVQLKDYGGVGGLKTVNMRSLGANHVGVFYDGIQLGNAQNGQIDLGKFSLDNMEEIALYNGQKSEIFQSAKDFGNSGAVYLRSRRPRFSDGEKYHLRATMKCGSFGLANPSILWEQKISDRVSSLFNAEYTYATGRYKFRYRRTLPNGETAYDTTAVRENGDIEALRIEGGFFGMTPTGKWNAKAYFYNSERGIPGPILNNVWRHGERQWDRNFFTQGSWENDFGRYRLMVNAKYACDYTEYLRDDPREIYVHNHYRQQEGYLSAAHLFRLFSWWDLAISTDLQWNYLDADLQDFAYPTRFTEMAAIATSFQWKGLHVQSSLLGTFIQDALDDKRVSTPPHKNEYSPALFMTYKPTRDMELRAFCKKAFRMPTFNDLYYTDVGNKLLDPEHTVQYDGGFTYRKEWQEGFFRAIEVQGDGYYNIVTDKIIAYPTGRQFRWSMINLGRVEIRGCDVSLQTTVQIGKVGMNLRGNYTYQKAQDFTDPARKYYGDQIPYTPLHSGSVLWEGNWKQWSLHYSFIYTGERYSNSENTAANRLQPWYTSDLALSRTFTLKKVACKAACEVNNLFNQSYDVIANYPMPGTNFKITLTIQL